MGMQIMHHVLLVGVKMAKRLICFAHNSVHILNAHLLNLQISL